MTAAVIEQMLNRQRDYYCSGATLSVAKRMEHLRRLYEWIGENEESICATLMSDLGKSSYESFMCEIGLVLGEISYMLKNLRRLTSKRRVRTPMAQFRSRSYVQPIPYGCTLVMSPWNYPFLLSVDPLVDAIAAGNTVMLKPSAYSPATSSLLCRMAEECFPCELVSVVTGGREENSALLGMRFDKIFFTGSKAVGRAVLHSAADSLTPVVLELGGKSPCVVDESADIALAARRIVFGKLLNCGQTCVAPDYILCHSSVKDKLVNEICAEIKRQCGDDPLANHDYGRIVNAKHFDRLLGLIDEKKVVIGGGGDRAGLRIAPTVMVDVTADDAVMQEEIFGPILPVLTFDSFDEVVDSLKRAEKPLALYLFSSSKEHIRRVDNELSFGGGCINDVVIHLATDAMGFGGVGESGMGSYHGECGFNAFSHMKSMVDKKTWIDMPMRYQPYKSRFFEKLLHFFLK